MPTFRTLTITLVASIFVAISSPSQAQSTEDLQTMQTFLEIMNSYFGIIESTHEVSSSVEMSAIMQMQKIQEVYEERNEKARAVDILRSVLDDSQNPTIRNAAYIMLGDTLKETGRSDEAIEILRQGLSENIKAAQ